MKTTVDDCKIVFLNRIKSTSGNLTIVEGGIDIPFDIKRIYYINDVPEGDERGSHAHKTLTQLIIAAQGMFTLILDDGIDLRNIRLSNDGTVCGVLIQPGIWRDLEDFRANTVCLVLASEKYNKDDYIRDYDEFLKYKKEQLCIL
jgi:hypothetical protein